MCLLITGTSKQIRATLLDTPGLLDDIFLSNADGVGAMYVTAKGALRTPKTLPKNLGQAHAFIAQLPQDNRNIAIHWRMKTHGAINLLNCHPYDVIPGQMALMHNGILSQGNRADVTKSDTWHYINDVVRPMMEAAPALMTNQAWLNLIEADITNSNRFAIMNSAGELVVLNKETGIEHDGMWFSNTYAWSPELLIPDYYKPPKYAYGGWRGANNLLDYDDLWRGHRRATSAGKVVDLKKPGVEEVEDESLFTGEDVWQAVYHKDVKTLEDFLWDDARRVFEALYTCRFVPETDGLTLMKLDTEVVEMLLRGDVEESCKAVDMRSSNYSDLVADVILNFGDWVPKTESAEDGDTLSATDQEVLLNLTGMGQEAYETALAEYAATLAAKDSADLPDPIDEVAALTAGAACVSEYAG